MRHITEAAGILTASQVQSRPSADRATPRATAFTAPTSSGRAVQRLRLPLAPGAHASQRGDYRPGTARARVTSREPTPSRDAAPAAKPAGRGYEGADKMPHTAARPPPGIRAASAKAAASGAIAQPPATKCAASATAASPGTVRRSLKQPAAARGTERAASQRPQPQAQQYAQPQQRPGSGTVRAASAAAAAPAQYPQPQQRPQSQAQPAQPQQRAQPQPQPGAASAKAGNPRPHRHHPLRIRKRRATMASGKVIAENRTALTKTFYSAASGPFALEDLIAAQAAGV